jgi:hypothetical protein
LTPKPKKVSRETAAKQLEFVRKVDKDLNLWHKVKRAEKNYMKPLDRRPKKPSAYIQDTASKKRPVKWGKAKLREFDFEEQENGPNSTKMQNIWLNHQKGKGYYDDCKYWTENDKNLDVEGFKKKTMP